MRLAERDGDGRNYVSGITHGLAGYQNLHCRCADCRAAKAHDDQLRWKRTRSKRDGERADA
jgi:hypothetical protein